jgi:MoaA/NifB/PqqE/SkfB family radical SAM enzyme
MALLASQPVKQRIKKKWRLWQIESSIACNLKCIMCPWQEIRQGAREKGLLSVKVWQSLVPYLKDVKSIDFTGGGEPLLQKSLLSWISQAKTAGCETGFLTNGLLLKRDLAENLMELRLDWIGFSIDGADRETYEAIRQGSDFDRVCSNIELLTRFPQNSRPLVMINFVIMNSNYHQLEEIILLAKKLKVDQVNFKQCDVIRGEHGKGLGLFSSEQSKPIRTLQKSLKKARKTAEKQGIKTTWFSFLPEEQPVCDQDPRNSLFIKYDGTVSPCINLSMGGSSSFFGQEIEFPMVQYGKLPENDLLEVWQSERFRLFRQSLINRAGIHDRVLASHDSIHSIMKLNEAFDSAIKFMPGALEGCRNCHYLYGV